MSQSTLLHLQLVVLRLQRSLQCFTCLLRSSWQLGPQVSLRNSCRDWFSYSTSTRFLLRSILAFFSRYSSSFFPCTLSSNCLTVCSFYIRATQAARSCAHFSADSEYLFTAVSARASRSVTTLMMEEQRVISPLRCLIVFLRVLTSLLSLQLPLMALSLVISWFLSCSSLCWRATMSSRMFLGLTLPCSLPALSWICTISMPSSDRSLRVFFCSLLSCLCRSSFSPMSFSLSWLAFSNLFFHISTSFRDLSSRREPSLILCCRRESSRSFSSSATSSWFLTVWACASINDLSSANCLRKLIQQAWAVTLFSSLCMLLLSARGSSCSLIKLIG